MRLELLQVRNTHTSQVELICILHWLWAACVCVCVWMREVFVATINLMKVARLSNKELIITICFRPMKSHKLSQTKSEHTTIFQFISEICLLWMIDKQVICSCSCSLLNYEMVFVGPITRAPLAFNAKRR